MPMTAFSCGSYRSLVSWSRHVVAFHHSRLGVCLARAVSVTIHAQPSESHPAPVFVANPSVHPDPAGAVKPSSDPVLSSHVSSSSLTVDKEVMKQHEQEIEVQRGH